MNPVLLIGFLQAFKQACDNNAIDMEASLWLFLYFLKNSSAAALTSRLSLMSRSSQSSIKGVLTIYCQVVNHPSKMHSTDDIIAETDGKIACYVKPSTIPSLEF